MGTGPGWRPEQPKVGFGTWVSPFPGPGPLRTFKATLVFGKPPGLGQLLWGPAVGARLPMFPGGPWGGNVRFQNYPFGG